MTRHEAECHCALSAVDSSSVPAVVCELPRRSRRGSRLNYSIWKVCEDCFTECDEGAEGKVFTYSFIPLLLHSRKHSITAWGGAERKQEVDAKCCGNHGNALGWGDCKLELRPCGSSEVLHSTAHFIITSHITPSLCSVWYNLMTPFWLSNPKWPSDPQTSQRGREGGRCGWLWGVEAWNGFTQLGACDHSAAQRQRNRNAADMPQLTFSAWAFTL